MEGRGCVEEHFEGLLCHTYNSFYNQNTSDHFCFEHICIDSQPP